MQEPRVRDPLDLLTPIRIHPDLMVPFQGEADSFTFGKEKRAIDSRFVEKQFTSEDYEKYIANDGKSFTIVVMATRTCFPITYPSKVKKLGQTLLPSYPY